MTAKTNGRYAPDGGKYATFTDGSGTVVVKTTATAGSKPTTGAKSPDGSIYFVLTDGAGNLV